jgi:hypothetical protein
MILIDLNQVVISNLMVQINKLSSQEELEEGLIKHMILNSILRVKKRFGSDYGKIVICCDNKNFWRKDYFPFYKGNRKKVREDSGYDWNLIFNTITQTKEDLRNYFPWKIIEVDRTEADDIIGTLVKNFSKDEKTLIVSSDKDFKQLQRYPNVTQYSPILKKFLVTDEPHKYIREHIIRGDRGDGIPNVLSEDDVFVNDKRQRPLSKKKLEEWLDIKRKPEDFCDVNMLERYRRNERLVDLTFVPENIQEEILNQFRKKPIGDSKKIFNYFIENKMVLMMDEISHFKEDNNEIIS